MKVIEGGFGKRTEEEEEQAQGSDVFQAFADMLSDMEEEEEYVQPTVMAIVSWPGVPSLMGSNSEDSVYLNAVLDFCKQDMLQLIAIKEAEETGIYDTGEDDGDDTIH